MIELDTCPFCGGRAKLNVSDRGVKVMCADCYCQTDTYNDDGPMWHITMETSAVEEAIKAWNRRPNDDDNR